MLKRFKILLTCIMISVFQVTNTVNAQILQDSTSVNLVKKDIDCIYNHQFNNAHEINLKIAKLYPGHPVVFLLKGMLTYWKNYPLMYSTPERKSFEEDMHQCIRLSEKNNKVSLEAEYLLANLCARGMLLKFYSDNKLTLESIPLASSTYKYLRRSFNYTNACSDLYYYTGVYNYYREAYPKVYPAYKPLTFFLPSGDKNTGLKELHTAAVNAVVLRAESYLLLSWIYLNFENKYQQALYFSKSLHELYPENVVYVALYIKNLLLMKYYTEAEKLIIPTLKETENKYLKAQLLVFQGILQEKKYHDTSLAQQFYNSGIGMISLYGVYGNEYTAYAYYGLSRINEQNGEKNNSRMFQKKAMKLGDFKKINFDK